MLCEELYERLRRLDEDADLLLDGPERYRILVVGGSALVLQGHLSRATHDIDLLNVPAVLHGLLSKYDMNSRAEAYFSNFPYNFEDRLVPLPIQGSKLDFYTPGLEDLVVAKLCSNRDTDRADVDASTVRSALDWQLLDTLARSEDEAKASALNDRCYQEFLTRYEAYVARWRTCGN